MARGISHPTINHVGSMLGACAIGDTVYAEEHEINIIMRGSSGGSWRDDSRGCHYLEIIPAERKTTFHCVPYEDHELQAVKEMITSHGMDWKRYAGPTKSPVVVGNPEWQRE
jgi:hypothetical protein